ncbi:MAG TPA: PilN domain-containing protein [Tepidisphaeraceae bacterium]|nr:PilN domain-containing protein [Tepidisphaeraceae bacterium]
MRELEFLPPSYQQTARRKRVVVTQSWIFLLLLVGLGTWAALAQGNVRIKQRELRDKQHDLDETHQQQRILAEQLSYRRKLQEQEGLVASIGSQVDMTRMLQTLDNLMPKEMSVQEFECTTEKQERITTSVAALPSAAPKPRQIDRKMRIRIVGVAPSNADIANFLTGLSSVSFFNQVAVKYAKDVTDNGHILREFEVSFVLELNQ